MTMRGGLGKGLGALIPTGARSVEEIPPHEIRRNPRQPRTRFDDAALATLAASIKQLGLLQPVVVRRMEDGGYEIVMGERRWRAAQRAGLTHIPALVVETDDRGALERALVENIHRQDLNPLEEAAAYKQLIEDAGLTHEQLAERVGLSRPAVSNALRLLELPDLVQRFVLDGKLSAGHARALLGLGGNPMIERLAARVAAEAMSVRETEELVRRTVDGSGAGGESDPVRRVGMPQTGLLEAGEELSEALNTRVKVTMGRTKGKIVIEFGSLQDLERIGAKITGKEVHRDDQER